MKTGDKVGFVGRALSRWLHHEDNCTNSDMNQEASAGASLALSQECVSEDSLKTASLRAAVGFLSNECRRYSVYTIGACSACDTWYSSRTMGQTHDMVATSLAGVEIMLSKLEERCRRVESRDVHHVM